MPGPTGWLLFAAMTCPNCGAEASGNFCAACGASLRAGKCARCGSELVPGARFCTKCGRAVGAAAGTPSSRGDLKSNLPWYIGAGVLLLMIGLLLVPMITGREPPDASASAPLPPNGSGTPPPLTGTPREQADRLFNRIMTEQDEGDTAQARFFAPMGIQAYEMAEPLDADGLYHLSLIHSVAGNYAAARAVAERILTQAPNHLLGLAAAAEAAERAGDTAAARAFYERFINAYDSESARAVAEYRDHERILPQHLAAARRITGR